MADRHPLPRRRRRDHLGGRADPRREARRVAIVLPYGSRVATSRINFRLLARDALTHEKRLSIVAGDAATRALAASAGLPVFATVGEYESSAEAPKASDGRSGPRPALTTARRPPARRGAVDGRRPREPTRRVREPRPPRAPAPRRPMPRLSASAAVVTGDAPPPPDPATCASETGRRRWAAVRRHGAGVPRRCRPPTSPRGRRGRGRAAAVVRRRPPARRARQPPVRPGIPRTPLLIGLGGHRPRRDRRGGRGLPAPAVGDGRHHAARGDDRPGLVPDHREHDGDRARSRTPASSGPARRGRRRGVRRSPRPASGSRRSRRTGEVRFENLDPTSSNTIAKGAVVSTESGVRFRTDAASRSRPPSSSA